MTLLICPKSCKSYLFAKCLFSSTLRCKVFNISSKYAIFGKIISISHILFLIEIVATKTIMIKLTFYKIVLNNRNKFIDLH